MTLQTWMEEYYPVEASTVKDRIEAIRHSLRKWEGIREENMDKHEVASLDGYSIENWDGSGDVFSIDGDSCALCHLYFDGNDYCDACPIFELTGRTCDGHLDSEEGNSIDLHPFYMWRKRGNPEPMIKVLKECLEGELENG